MKVKDPKQRYVYMFKFRGQEDGPVKYATIAYSLLQAVEQLMKKHPNKNIDAYFRNEGFDITRKLFVPKEEPPEEKGGYQQLDFKGFINS